MKYNRLKRAVSGLLAGLMVMTYPSATIISFAAGQYNIKFVSEDAATAYVIEGGVVNAKAQLPPAHDFDAKKPFLIKIEGATAADGLISVAANSRDYYTITANDYAATGSIPAGSPPPPSDPNKVGVTTYSMEPVLTAVLQDGTGTAQIVNSVAGEPDGFYSMTVKSTREELPITTESSFTFTAVSTESADGDISFSAAQGGKGLFAGLTEQVTTDGKVTTANGRKAVKIQLGKYGFELGISMPTGMLIEKGSSFTVSYQLQGINPLILYVVTPKWAVNQTASSIRNDPVDPLAPDKSKIPYIKLADGDSLTSITTNFEVLSQVARYNSKDNSLLHINWDWEPAPDQADCENVVSFGADGRQTRSVTLNPRQEDVKGKLRAQVEYKLQKPFNGQTMVQSDWVEIGITILGTGTPPKLTPLTQKVGTKPTESITKIPSNMDVYTGNVPLFTEPQYPHTFSASMVFGTGRGRAEKTIIRAEGMMPDAIKVYLDNSPVPYEFGTDIINTDKLAGHRPLSFVATKKGQVTLYFDYYVRNNKGNLVKADTSEKFSFIVDDTTPRDFAQLSSLLIQSPKLAADPSLSTTYPGGAISYGFKSDTFLYANIELPNLVDEINITPIIPDNKGVNPQMTYNLAGGGSLSGGMAASGTVDNNTLVAGGKIPMHVESPRTLTLTLKAENGREQLYILTMNRMPPDKDSSLKNLTVTDVDGGAILKGFSPTQKEYTATVPYKTRWAKFEIEKNSVWSKETFIPPLSTYPGDSTNEAKWVKLKYPGDIFGGVGDFNGLSSITEQKVVLQAQDLSGFPDGSKMYSTTYKVRIIRQDPSKNTFATDVTVKDDKNRPVVFDNNTKFDKNTKKYSMHIPYSSKKLSLSILPEDVVAQSVTLTAPGGIITTQDYAGDGVPLVFTVDTPIGGSTEMTFPLSFTVKAESGAETNPPYVINVVRNDPDQDSTLTALEVKDQDNAVVKAFSFNPQTPDYVFSVPFNTEQIKVIPKPRSPLATAKVNGKIIDERDPSFVTLIKPGETKNIKVEIFPEDVRAPARQYTLTITREMPSTDARLKNITVTGGENFLPRFTPTTTIYNVSMPEGTQSITFTAVPVHVGSTLTINGVDIKPGTASDPYEPFDAKSKVDIVVTAQDGKTKMTYTIHVTNQNLIPKSSNADLEQLQVKEGSMSPRFKPSITEYEVAVKDDISSVDIIPIPKSEDATVKVFSESKELGDYYDRYSSAIRDGENVFTIKVTAEDEKATKEYTVTVYRKDEEKQGSYKPITADMVNFTTNPIVVDISRYTVVAAEVFNTLKEEYPEKTMVFQGNDYSLQLTGKDMGQLVPHAAIYDLGITFNSPNEDDIWEIILNESRNDGIEPVMIHFNHHGALPGKMLFTLSLGRTYRTQNATWNYYNEERERIDYYGGVRTNSRGTFTVPITHMSTYIYSEDRIVGAENKSGDLGATGSVTGGSGINKPNPNTGTEGCK
ncbi:MAG: cadherin-like beta sandwich domain-containing protein [Angelakisella sp.]